MIYCQIFILNFKNIYSIFFRNYATRKWKRWVNPSRDISNKTRTKRIGVTNQSKLSVSNAFPIRKENFSKMKKILFYNTFFGKENFYFGFGHSPFLECEVSNCYTTRNRSLLCELVFVYFYI